MTLRSDEIVRAGNAALTLLALPGTTTASDSWPHGLSADVAPSETTAIFAIPVSDWMTSIEALGHIVDNLTNDLSETKPFWGVAFPRCPGHAHPASYEADDHTMLLRCPVFGDEIRRVTV